MDKEKLIRKLSALRTTFPSSSDAYDLITSTIIFVTEQDNEIKRLKQMIYDSDSKPMPQPEPIPIKPPDTRSFHELGYMQMALFNRKGRK